MAEDQGIHHPHGLPTIHQGQQQLQTFWADQESEIEGVTDFKNHELPLARIKKIMKSDEEVRMISAEAPVLFAKACELFIRELTLRAWIHTEENKRRTLQKTDIATAIQKCDIYDFLIDIVPREDLKANQKKMGLQDDLNQRSAAALSTDMTQYFYQTVQQAQGADQGPSQLVQMYHHPQQISRYQQTAMMTHHHQLQMQPADTSVSEVNESAETSSTNTSHAVEE